MSGSAPGAAGQVMGTTDGALDPCAAQTGACAGGPALSAQPPAAAPAVSPATSSPAVTSGSAPASYAPVVSKVLPSVVLIRTASGLGSGVVLDDKGNIVTNAHVAGEATSFQVQ